MAQALSPRARSVAHYDRYQRFYDLPDGRVFPSVTTILEAAGKPALQYWAANKERDLVIEAAASLWEDAPLSPKMSREAFIASLTNRLGKTRAHQKELQKASEIGSSLHALIEWNLRRELGQVVGPEPQVKDSALWAFMVWEDWRKTVNLKPRAIEQVVWSTTHEYAGTMDLLAECTLPDIGTVLAVADWKTGKAVYGEAFLQNTAYVNAMVEMGHVTPPVYGLIVRLPKVENDPEPEFVVLPWERLEALFPVFLAVKKLWTWQEEERLARTGEKKPEAPAPAPALPVQAGQLAKHQADLLEHIRTLPPGTVTVEEQRADRKVFVWLSVAVLIRLGAKKPDGPLPVLLSDLSAAETKRIRLALKTPELVTAVATGKADQVAPLPPNPKESTTIERVRHGSEEAAVLVAEEVKSGLARKITERP